mmetsp:Transcript_31405/g.27749  ORF Transcript_31405/g.27749 Transcript_31405/m.27749 type:complete len:89 (+) Transcript_31405:58-324(+)
MKQFSFKNSSESKRSSFNSHKINGSIRSSRQSRNKQIQEMNTMQNKPRKEMVIIRPDKETKNKFDTRPVLIKDFSNDFSGTDYGQYQI